MTPRDRPGLIMGHSVLNANSRHAALAFARAGVLREFHTSLDSTALVRLLPESGLRTQLERRSLPPEVHRLTRTHPWTEIARLARRHVPALHRPERFEPDAVSHAVDIGIARRLTQDATAVYAYEDAAEASFVMASSMGIRRLYDLPIGYWRAGKAILDTERELRPEWSATIVGDQVKNQQARLARKERELHLANHVIVASSFTARTLEAATSPRPSVSILPYGAPPITTVSRSKSAGPLRVLFVGQLTQRKGISYMFEALRRLGGRATLTVIGRPAARVDAMERELSRPGVTWHASLPHERVLSEMSNHDVLLFPSLFEGFGLVLLEAMAQGMPIIATDHTAAPDLIVNGVQGWIVPIATRLEELENDRSLLNDMGEAARSRAADASWARYRDSLVEVTRHELLRPM